MPWDDYKRLIMLALIMMVVVVAVAGSAFALLYRVAFEQQRLFLLDIAQSQARMIESVAYRERQHAATPEGAHRAAVHQIIQALDRFHFAGATETAEFALGELRGETMVYLLRHRQTMQREPVVVGTASPLGEPMRRALAGETGTVVGLDYRGHEVIAAFTWVPVVRLGLVTKIDVAEVRAPFVGAAATVAALAVALTSLGSIFFCMVGEPVVRRLRQSESRFRQLFETMSSGVAVYEPVADGSGFLFKDVNRAAERIDRMRRDDVVGRDVTEVFPDAERFGILAALQRVHRTGEAERLPPALYRDDRVVGWRDNALYRLPGGEIVAVYEDVSERMNAEEALRQSEERYRALVESQTELFCQFLPDTTLTYVNGAYAAFYQSTPDALVGSRWIEFLSESDRPSAFADLDRFSPDAPLQQREERLVAPGGVQRWYLWSGRAFFDADGRVTSFQAIGTDITERKTAQEALAENEARYRLLFDGSPNPILVLDSATTQPLQYNEPLLRLLGYDREDFASVPMWAYEVGETADATARRMARIPEDGAAEFESLWRTRSGESRTVVLNVRMMHMAGRSVFLIVVTDITARVAAERRVRELQEQLLRVARISELGQTTSALAHELMQPLAAAMNYAHACRRLVPGEGDVADRAREMATKAAVQIDRAGKIIRGIRELVGKDESERELQPFRPVIEEACDLAFVGTASQGMEVEVDLADDLPPVAINKIQIQQVILNLVHNAIEAMEHCPRRSLRVEARAGEQSIEVRVHDTGPGISEALAPRLFQPFVSSKPNGIGIGLSISRTIVQAHGGSLSVVRNASGGATFLFTIPTTSASATAEAKARAGTAKH